MTNLLLRRLATKGYLRIRQLNRRKVEYFLTPRSLSEKLQKTYHYTLKTIESFGLIRSEIRRILAANLSSEIRQIVLVGEGDLADLTALILQEVVSSGHAVARSPGLPSATRIDTLVIDASSHEQTPGWQNGGRRVHLMESLAQGKGRASPELALR